MTATTEFQAALRRLTFQAEVGGWYKDDSEVNVQIRDLYSIFHKLKELEGVIKAFIEWETDEHGSKSLLDDEVLWKRADEVLK